MRCKDVRKHISAYVDNEVNEHLKKEIETHIANCEICAEELKRERFIRAIFVGLRSPEPSQYLFTRVLARLEKKATFKPVKAIVYVAVALILFVVSAVAGRVISGEILKYTQEKRLEQVLSTYTGSILDEPEYLLSEFVIESEGENEK